MSRERMGAAGNSKMTLDELQNAVGTVLGQSDWTLVSAQRIAGFADVTEDWQEIHLDDGAGRAAGFDGAVAHGFLSLSLLSKMSYEALPKISGQTASINYGFDRIRFLAPVPSGARVRATFTLREITARDLRTLSLLLDVTMDIEGQSKPALSALWRVMIVL